MTAGVASRELVDDLRAALHPSRVRVGPSELSLYRKDASNMEGAAGVVCLPETAAEVQACVRIASRHGVAFVPRGSGTGLAGGAVPIGGEVVISLTKMNQVISVDAVNRRAWVQPGVLNLDLSRQVDHLGLHFAPDPSSQQTCSIGGNVANNSGGPHCLAEGVTNAHILGVRVVLPEEALVGVVTGAVLSSASLSRDADGRVVTEVRPGTEEEIVAFCRDRYSCQRTGRATAFT